MRSNEEQLYEMVYQLITDPGFLMLLSGVVQMYCLNGDMTWLTIEGTACNTYLDKEYMAKGDELYQLGQTVKDGELKYTFRPTRIDSRFKDDLLQLLYVYIGHMKGTHVILYARHVDMYKYLCKRMNICIREISKSHQDFVFEYWIGETANEEQYG